MKRLILVTLVFVALALQKSELVVKSVSTPYHQTGRMSGDAWATQLGDPPNKYLQYGPYTRDIEPGAYNAIFCMSIAQTTPSNQKVVTLDVL